MKNYKLKTVLANFALALMVILPAYLFATPLQFEFVILMMLIVSLYNIIVGGSDVKWEYHKPQLIFLFFVFLGTVGVIAEVLFAK